MLGRCLVCCSWLRIQENNFASTFSSSVRDHLEDTVHLAHSTMRVARSFALHTFSRTSLLPSTSALSKCIGQALCSTLRKLDLWRLCSASMSAYPPSSEALRPSFTVRSDDVVLLHVFAAAVFASAGRLQRRMPVEVAILFHGQVSDSALLQKQNLSNVVASHH